MNRHASRPGHPSHQPSRFTGAHARCTGLLVIEQARYSAWPSHLGYWRAVPPDRRPERDGMDDAARRSGRSARPSTLAYVHLRTEARCPCRASVSSRWSQAYGIAALISPLASAMCSDVADTPGAAWRRTMAIRGNDERNPEMNIRPNIVLIHGSSPPAWAPRPSRSPPATCRWSPIPGTWHSSSTQRPKPCPRRARPVHARHDQCAKLTDDR